MGRTVAWLSRDAWQESQAVCPCPRGSPQVSSRWGGGGVGPLERPVVLRFPWAPSSLLPSVNMHAWGLSHSPRRAGFRVLLKAPGGWPFLARTRVEACSGIVCGPFLPAFDPRNRPELGKGQSVSLEQPCGCQPPPPRRVRVPAAGPVCTWAEVSRGPAAWWAAGEGGAGRGRGKRCWVGG